MHQPSAPSRRDRSSQRPDPFARPLDALLQRLREAGLPYYWSQTDLKIWKAVCPSCRAPEWGLSVRESYVGGQVTVRCAGGCSDGEIRTALDAAAREVDPYALELAVQARDIAEAALALGAAHAKGQSPELRVAA